MTQQQETLIEFPCFPIKVMGVSHRNFSQVVLDIALKHAPDVTAADLDMRLARMATTCRLPLPSMPRPTKPNNLGTWN